MDEPFGALDAQTREVLQNELLHIWEKTHKTIVFITHSIDEAAYLAQRVIVMTAQPGKIKKIVDVPLPNHRYNDEEIKASASFVNVRYKLWDLLKDEVVKSQKSEGDLIPAVGSG